MKLFEYVVFYSPKKNNDNNEGKAKILVPVTVTLAESAQSVTLLAARAIPEEYLDRLDEVEVAVRPF